MMSYKCFISQRLKSFAGIPESYSKKKINQEATFNFFVRKNAKKIQHHHTVICRCHSTRHISVKLFSCVRLVDLSNYFCFGKMLIIFKLQTWAPSPLSYFAYCTLSLISCDEWLEQGHHVLLDRVIHNYCMHTHTHSHTHRPHYPPTPPPRLPHMTLHPLLSCCRAPLHISGPLIDRPWRYTNMVSI